MTFTRVDVTDREQIAGPTDKLVEQGSRIDILMNDAGYPGKLNAFMNIRVNCVAPGPLDTDMIRDLGPDAVRGMVNKSPMRRLGSVEEIAHLVAWLCSDASHCNTVAVFDMSGGRARY